MININEYIENSKKNERNSLDITNHIENVIKDFDVENIDKIVNKHLDKVLDKNLEESSKIYEKALKSNINVIENFLQDLNTENMMSSWINEDINNTKPTSNFIDRKNEVVEILKVLPPDIKGTYINKVLNAVTQFNNELSTKKEPEHTYDFER